MIDRFTRLNAYRIMWIFVFFDLPTETKMERRAAAKFRKDLLRDGFDMFQFSIYLRHCASRENAAVHFNRVKEKLPKKGKVGMVQLTDRQFGMMEIFHGQKEVIPNKPANQLTMF